MSAYSEAGSAGVRYRIGDAGQFLALRQTARNICAQQEEGPSTDGAVVLDFTGVEAVTGAFIDELLSGVAAAHPGCRIRIEAANEALREVLVDVIQRPLLERWFPGGGLHRFRTPEAPDTPPDPQEPTP